MIPGILGLWNTTRTNNSISKFKENIERPSLFMSVLNTEFSGSLVGCHRKERESSHRCNLTDDRFCKDVWAKDNIKHQNNATNASS